MATSQDVVAVDSRTNRGCNGCGLVVRTITILRVFLSNNKQGTKKMAEQDKEIEEKKEKPGYKTTEFYLTLLAFTMAMLMASGVLGEGGLDVTIVSLILAGLSKVGYDFNRAFTKRGESRERASIASLASIASIAASNDNQDRQDVAAGKN